MPCNPGMAPIPEETKTKQPAKKGVIGTLAKF